MSSSDVSSVKNSDEVAHSNENNTLGRRRKKTYYVNLKAFNERQLHTF